ncbi:hypothetical protein CBR_g31276 [Chara braunii]|uniref:Uncharacterized protein n=1 Tax=Chara braunii TaxID=69332 RepID=A0A388LES8_CHABU|nr:hypothetical protein CBR_g31276 [Chara braunii]|eukprot:GBG80722.1 hypothetical protein CBR_g31276 [Chara braunii]
MASGAVGGSRGNEFRSASDATIALLQSKSAIWKHVMQGQKVGTWEKMHGDHKLRCNYSEVIFQGNQSKAARHFTQPKKCKQASLSVLADIWNKTQYRFDPRHEEGILRYIEEMDIVDERSLSGRGTQRRQAGGGFGAHRDDDMMDPVDEVEAFLDREARRETDDMRGTTEVGEEGGLSPRSPHLSGEEVVMTARGTRGGSRDAEHIERERGKMYVDEVDDDVFAQGRKRPRQTTIDEVYDGDALQRTRSTFLEWVYDAGISFRVFRRSSWRRHHKAVAELPRGVRMVHPSHKEIGGSGVIEQRDRVATRLAHIRVVGHIGPAPHGGSAGPSRPRHAGVGFLNPSSQYTWSFHKPLRPGAPAIPLASPYDRIGPTRGTTYLHLTGAVTSLRWAYPR